MFSRLYLKIFAPFTLCLTFFQPIIHYWDVLMQDAMLNVFIFISWEVGFQIICEQFSTHGFRSNTNDERELSTLAWRK